jgi:lipopolysaccharide export system protein LptC
MKTVINVLALGAAVAGIAYLLRENDSVKSTLDRAKERASGAFDKVKGTLISARGDAKTELADLS